LIWLIGLGGSLGAAARYSLGIFINKKYKHKPLPLGTLIINISGSFVLGLLANLYSVNEISEAVWLFAGVGFCGAYTTFSTFGYETITLIQSNKAVTAGVYIFSSVIFSILTAAIGFVIL
jgi:fluoride exporter